MRQFVEIIKSLYMDEKLDEKKISELFVDGKITKSEKAYILDSN